MNGVLPLQVEELEVRFVKPMLELYLSSDAAATTRDWNLERQAIIREAVQKLVPQLQEEVSGRLLGDAREVVVEQFSDALWRYASLPPVQASPLFYGDECPGILPEGSHLRLLPA